MLAFQVGHPLGKPQPAVSCGALTARPAPTTKRPITKRPRRKPQDSRHGAQTDRRGPRSVPKLLLNPSQSSPGGVFQRDTGRTPILGQTSRETLRKQIVDANEKPRVKNKIVIMNRAAKDGQVHSLLSGQLTPKKWEATTSALMGTQAIKALTVLGRA